MSLMTPRCSLRARWIGLVFGGGFLEPLTKFLVGLLKAVAMAAVVAAGLADDEAEGCGQRSSRWVRSLLILRSCDLLLGRAVRGATRWTVAREIP